MPLDRNETRSTVCKEKGLPKLPESTTVCTAASGAKGPAKPLASAGNIEAKCVPKPPATSPSNPVNNILGSNITPSTLGQFMASGKETADTVTSTLDASFADNPTYESRAGSTSRRESTRRIKCPKKDLPDDQPQHGARKPKLTRELNYCYKDIIKELLSKKHEGNAWLFRKPLHLSTKKLGLHDYLDVIQRPMDLTTVKKKLEARKYCSVTEFENDVQLIFTNCYKHYPEESKVVELAHNLQHVFEEKFAQMPGDTSAMMPENSLKSESDDYETSEDESEDEFTEHQKELLGQLKATEKEFRQLLVEHTNKAYAKEVNQRDRESRRKRAEKQPSATQSAPAATVSALKTTAPFSIGREVPATLTGTAPMDTTISTTAATTNETKPKNTAEKRSCENDRPQKQKQLNLSLSSSDGDEDYTRQSKLKPTSKIPDQKRLHANNRTQMTKRTKGSLSASDTDEDGVGLMKKQPNITLTKPTTPVSAFSNTASASVAGSVVSTPSTSSVPMDATVSTTAPETTTTKPKENAQKKPGANNSPQKPRQTSSENVEDDDKPMTITQKKAATS